MYKYENPDTLRSEPPREEKENAIQQAFKQDYQGEKELILVRLASTYFTRYGIEIPMEVWLSKWMTMLIEAEDEKTAKRALGIINKWSADIHKKHTPKLKLKDSTVDKIRRICKRTFADDKLNEMAVNNTIYNDLEKGFITDPCFRVLHYYLKKSPPDTVVYFGNVENVLNAADRLYEDVIAWH